MRTVSRTGGRLSGVAAVAALLVLSLMGTVVAQSPFPPRRGIVANGTDISLSEARIANEFRDRIGNPFGLEGLVLLVDDCRPDPEVYLDQALVYYGLAPQAGTMYDDAVVWFVCRQPRFVGLFYGAGVPGAAWLDQDAVTELMASHLEAGNFTGAVTSGIEAVAAALASGGEEEPASRGRWAGLAVLLAGVAVGAWWWRRQRRPPLAPQEEQAPQVATPQAILEARLAKLEERLVPNSPALARLVLAYESVGDEAVLELHRQHLAMVERLQELKRQVEALTTGAVPAALAEDTRAREERYRGPLAEADELLAYVDRLEAEAAHAEMLTDKAAVLVVEARQALAKARPTYERLAASLSLPPAEEAFSLPTFLVTRAEEVLATGDRLTAGRLAEEARDLAGRVAQVATEMGQTREAIARAAELFERVDDYAPSSWADIRGNGSEAEESLEAAVELFRRTVTAEREAFGEDPAAGFVASLERVFDELARARELVDAIARRLANLRQAQKEAASALEGARAAAAAARSWLADPAVDADVDAGPLAELDRAEAMLAEVEAAMTGPSPDWLAILRRIEAADRVTDAALAAANRQQEQMEARRRRLAAARTTAEAAVDRAERFLAAHRGDVDSASVARLEDARQALRRAQEAAEEVGELSDAARAAALEAAVEAYRRAGDLADAAYDAMATDFERAEQQRTAYVPRPSWIGPTVPIPMGPRRIPFPGLFGGWGGGPVLRPPRRSRWGGRRPAGGGRPFSSRRGGGRGW